MWDDATWTPRRLALALSAGLHVGVAALAVFGMPFWSPPILIVPTIEVELVRVAEETEQPKPPERRAEAPKPEPPKPEPPKPEPPKPEPVNVPPPPPPKPAPAKPPEPPRAEPAPLPKPKPVEAMAPPPPQPRPKPTPPANFVAPDEGKSFDPAHVAALLNRMQKREEKPEPLPASPAAEPRVRMADALTISELEHIRRQFERCWSPPAGARDAGSLVVKIRIHLNPDGSLRAPPELVDRSRLNDAFWQAAAESALRAVRRCEPLRDLPAGKYERWRDIELTFDPKEMVG